MDRAVRRMDADAHRVVEDLARARRSAGLSLRTVGASCGVSKTTIQRIETGVTRTLEPRILAAIGAAVGLDVRLTAYPAGDAIRDAGQVRLLERLRVRLHPSLGWATEVPLPIDGDLRAWDAVIRAATWHRPVEAEAVLDDLQATDRRLGLKRRDGGEDHLILLVADTRRNRRALAAAAGAFANLPVRTREILAALKRGDDAGAGGIVIL